MTSTPSRLGPAFADARAAIRLLAEQSDGLEVTIADQTASYRYDQAGALDDWQTLGSTVTTEGDSAPQDLSATITGKFWIRWGIAIRKPHGTDGIGVASVGAQLSFPTDRTTLLAGPAVINAYTSPVGGNWTELLALDGRKPPVSVASGQGRAVSRRSVANPLHGVAVRNWGSRSARRGTKMKGGPWGRPCPVSESGVAGQTTFTNATTNKAQLCRVVLRADNSGTSSEQRGRVYIALSKRYA